MPLWRAYNDRLLTARGNLFPFVPVFLGIGIGWWFSLPWEPQIGFYGALLLAGAGLVVLSFRVAASLQPLALAALCVCLGMLAAGLRAHLVAGPMLDFRYYGAVQGRIVGIDRSQTDALRLTLDRVVLERLSPDQTPYLVRISLKGDQHWLVPSPGQVVMTTASLAAPDGPVEPDGFDFRRMAFFLGLGAVGYTTTPVLLWSEPSAAEQTIPRIRAALTGAILNRVAGDAGAFSAGVMTGDRSALSLQAVQDLRDSSLAHLLAISGMNLAFLISFTFALFRGGLALVPYVALRLNTKKLAALISIPVAGFYLLLSGSNVATERAFVMVMVALGAILLDRAAISLRTVAISATALLLWQPEALLEPGFQMSFAATVALISGFELLARLVDRKRLWRGVPALMTLFLSSLIGGFATAPFAAAHFNRFTGYGLVANLLTVPVMGAVVMPAGAVAALLAPFGLERPALWVMGKGSEWILWVAHQVAAMEGAVTAVPMPPETVLPLLTLGGLWLILWPFRERLAGLVPVIAALWLWVQHDRLLLLVDADARLLGLMTPDGRAISRETGGGFAATNWLENDGDLTDQKTAAARAGFVEVQTGLRFDLAGRRGLVLPPDAPVDCHGADLLILATALPKGAAMPCRVIDLPLLEKTGTLAVMQTGQSLTLRPTYLAKRLWTPPDAGGVQPKPVQ